MAMQLRALSGSLFEKEICEKLGYQSKPTSPQIKWSGRGRCNFDKVKSIDFNPTLFRPLSNSSYKKWDVITDTGKKIEVKKYRIEQLDNWVLYSEPIVIVTGKQIGRAHV